MEITGKLRCVGCAEANSKYIVLEGVFGKSLEESRDGCLEELMKVYEIYGEITRRILESLASAIGKKIPGE